MKGNRERILRDIEYVNGGISVLKALCNKEDQRSTANYQLFDEWQDILCSIIDMIEEDYENAENA